MRLDHTDPASITKCTNSTKHTLYGLRRNLQQGLPVGADGLDVRLVANQDGELWFATGDVQYDTVHGAACEAITLNPNDDDDALDSMAADLVQGVSDQLAEQDDDSDDDAHPPTVSARDQFPSECKEGE